MSRTKPRPLNPLLASLDAVDRQAVTHGWKTLNRRRNELIDKEFGEQGISYVELVELENLQRLCDLRSELKGPLPWDTLRKLEALIAKHKGG